MQQHVDNICDSVDKQSHRTYTNKFFYYIDTDEIPGVFLLLKNHIFISFTCEDIGVAMVTNTISQLQESFPFLTKFSAVFPTNWTPPDPVEQAKHFYFLIVFID